MGTRNLCLSMLVLLTICAIPAVAQESLGDFVTQYSYGWLAGQWTATDNEGQRITVDYKWGLDKHIVLMDLKMGDFKFHGMTMLVASTQEIVFVGADNEGGTWKGTWGDDYGDAVLKIERTRGNGKTEKMEVVHRNIDAKTMKLSVYGVDSWGYRNTQPLSALTYKRQSQKN